MKTFMCVCICLVLGSAAFGTVVNVPGDQPTIQAGLNAANPFDTVLVAPGIYAGDGNRDLDFLGKSIYLLGGGFYGSNVVIQCDGSELEQHIGIYFHTSEDSNAVVDGITITGAYKPMPPRGYFGAIHCVGSSPRIRNCTITDNSHLGIEVTQGGTTVIADCIVQRNMTGIRVGREPMFGGANVRIERTLVLDNDSTGIELFDYGDHFIENCLVRNNAVDGILKFVDMPKSQPTQPDNWFSYVRRTIVVDNGRSGLHNYWVGEMMVECTDAFGNGTSDFLGVEGSAGDAQGNISADPNFCNPGIKSFYLKDNSPCAPANNSCAVLMGPLGVNCYCCIGWTGNVNKSLAELPDLSDLSLLIGYLILAPRPVLPCPTEADINNSGQIDITDLSSLIAFLSSTVPDTYDPPACPGS